MQYEERALATFPVMGIAVRTTNRQGQSAADIGALWKRFFEEQLAALIPGKLSPDLYCVYTDYESAADGWYTTLLGCRVYSLDKMPGGFTGFTVPAARYYVFRPVGPLPEAVQQTWLHIWQANFNRRFSADFDVYSVTPGTAQTEVRTYLSIL